MQMENMQVEFQYQQSLQSLKLELEKNTNKANDLQRELSKSKLLVKQFQEASMKAEVKIRLLEEELEKVKNNIKKTLQQK